MLTRRQDAAGLQVATLFLSGPRTGAVWTTTRHVAENLLASMRTLFEQPVDKMEANEREV